MSIINQWVGFFYSFQTFICHYKLFYLVIGLPQQTVKSLIFFQGIYTTVPTYDFDIGRWQKVESIEAVGFSDYETDKEAVVFLASFNAG